MLAIQHSNMGSPKPPGLDMPFGYAFDSNSTFPFPSPTAPAPGPPLLDDSESNLLDSFFDGVSSDHFNDFFSDINTQDGGELGGGWEELPPTFMGTRVTFGQQQQQQPPPPQLSHEMPSMNFGETNNRMHPPSSHASLAPPFTSADVIAAATVLQNSSNAQSHRPSRESLFGNHGIPSPFPHHPIRPQYPASIPALDRARDASMRDTLYTEMMFGPNHAGADLMRRPQAVPQKVDIRWGSDAAFGSPQGFIPPSHAAKVEEAESKRLQALDEFIGVALGAESSAENTRPNSPTMQRNPPTQRQSSSGIAKEEEVEAPKKRRKSKFGSVEDEGGEEEESPPKVDGRKKRKSVARMNASPPGPSEGEAGEGHKRRKSTSVTTAKATRENLTEDQKRENHIKSEQKRRTLIREGFEDLGELVPGLRGGGFSKSAILVMTADWLEELMQGNELLRQRIDAVKRR
ncbi:hypothetical protein DSL72_002302 [Monilinia vaccinii-corymbosi]|uniref:BHLH domain-containing protein n=1 Tax=Monilinia vaccinii-corymbosi TaxID=61207 RepID=A0A8A3PCB1_9HELO|nr:hypothetical protein DSL72_002302 [Monilinia vaccinii-corymbosi]